MKYSPRRLRCVLQLAMIYFWCHPVFAGLFLASLPAYGINSIIVVQGRLAGSSGANAVFGGSWEFLLRKRQSCSRDTLESCVLIISCFRDNGRGRVGLSFRTFTFYKPSLKSPATSGVWYADVTNNNEAYSFVYCYLFVIKRVL